MCRAGLLSPELEKRFRALLLERNWLVHKSRAQNRNVIHNDDATTTFVVRLEAMTDESDKLMTEVLRLMGAHVKGIGITQQQIDAAANSLLEQWHGPSTI